MTRLPARRESGVSVGFDAEDSSVYAQCSRPRTPASSAFARRSGHARAEHRTAERETAVSKLPRFGFGGFVGRTTDASN
ncbi:hypothetical protein [Halorussus lipolyticus]|uniref:hypothetical protein n=1 Tax=Halorussus lipolyticus TaxID=3034024 RepID=UPI0023E89CAC|nr:hypothetical protein [Halorussus sp. DT80]